MTIGKFNEVQKATWIYANATETGCRNAKKRAEKMMTEWVKMNCDKHKNSVYAVYLRTENLGTRRYGDYLKTVEVFKMTECRETEKCYIDGSNRYNKDSIIGYLSEK